ncbi:MAG: hypothetical protein O3B83_06280 [Bacteroidetes bacterium]|nr:hypothetical protein [Bacteroidota bacterium]
MKRMPLRSYFLMTTLVLIVSSLVAQEECGSSSMWWRDHERYIPGDETPIFYVRINFVIPQRSDGTGNFTASDPEHEFQLRTSVEKLNEHWLKLTDPKNSECYRGEDFVPSTYIQFVLNDIIYFQDNYYWNAENGAGCPNNTNWFLNDLEKEVRKNPEWDRAINIYMPNDSSDYDVLVLERTFTDEPQSKPGCSELPTNKELDRSSRICFGNAYNKYWWMQNVVVNSEKYNKNLHPWSVLKTWDYGGRGSVMAHELGHSMGLNHSNEYHGRNKCHESIMNQLFASPHNYLQPSEIGKMHRNLRLTNIRNFLQEDVYVPTAIVIEKPDEVLDIDFKAYEDFIIKDGASLRIACALSLPAEARIYVEPGGRLIIDEAVLSTRGDEGTPVIELQEKKTWFLTPKRKRKSADIELIGSATVIGKTLKEKVR